MIRYINLILFTILFQIALKGQQTNKQRIAFLYAQIDSTKELIIHHKNDIRKLQAVIDSINSAELQSVKISADNYINHAKLNGISAYTSGKTVEIRDQPNFSSKVLTTIDGDIAILVLSYQNDYYYIRSQEIEGYVHQLWIKVNDNVKLLKHATTHGNLDIKAAQSTQSKSKIERAPKTISQKRESYNKNCKSTRCTGYTKKDKRCSNSTTNCNGRCHLHD